MLYSATSAATGLCATNFNPSSCCHPSEGSLYSPTPGIVPFLSSIVKYILIAIWDHSQAIKAPSVPPIAVPQKAPAPQPQPIKAPAIVSPGTAAIASSPKPASAPSSNVTPAAKPSPSPSPAPTPVKQLVQPSPVQVKTSPTSSPSTSTQYVSPSSSKPYGSPVNSKQYGSPTNSKQFITPSPATSTATRPQISSQVLKALTISFFNGLFIKLVLSLKGPKPSSPVSSSVQKPSSPASSGVQRPQPGTILRSQAASKDVLN